MSATNAIANWVIVTLMKIVLVVHNVRSAHNVGSLLRSADGLGVEKVYLTGYTPYPWQKNDGRLPHLADKIDRQISKTALGAERSVPWQHTQNIDEVISLLKDGSFEITALEQTGKSQNLNTFKPARNIALIVGNEVEGIDAETLKLADVHLEIPMKGKKESFNVSVAGSIALYHLANLDTRSA
jgi:23S rRNA (guanosine2251-2'-O)-methyltransferase